jgi:hypothetical protein
MNILNLRASPVHRAPSKRIPKPSGEYVNREESQSEGHYRLSRSLARRTHWNKKQREYKLKKCDP